MGDKQSLDQVLASVDSGRRSFLKSLLIGAAVAVPVMASLTLTNQAVAQDQDADGKKKEKKKKKADKHPEDKK